jgi:methylmalonyl-CoA mutase N-terminal domain/subunit
VQQAVESGAVTVVGVNRFTEASPVPDITLPDFSALAARQRARLAAAKAQRNAPAVGKALGELGGAAAGSGALMPPIIEAVRARATLGEISDSLRTAWGTHDGK